MRTKTHLKASIVMSVFLVGMAPAIAAGVTIYVDADASTGGNGSSWGTAYKYLQDALNKSPTSGDDIWVAEGTYYPDEDEGANVDPNDRTATFQLINGVAIKGGYAGVGASDPNEHDIELYETILSGDINMPGDSSDNSYHVVTGSGTNGTAVLDGFTITAGNANAGSFPDNYGGGMYNFNMCSPTLTNCTFSDNSATQQGGGMYNELDSRPTVTNCTFSWNDAHQGGGMYNEGSSPTLTNCDFIDNLAGRGGGMYNYVGSPWVTNCIFSGNVAEAGGGMYNYVGSPSLTNCTFSGNSARRGGGMFNTEGSPTVINCTFRGNSAGAYGGGMRNQDSSSTLTNCILWGNTAPSRPQIYGSATVSYSDVEGGWPGTENIDEDPLFIDPNGLDGIGGTADDNLRLSAGSPCIDAGDNTAVPGGVTTDLGGRLRFVDGDCNDTDIVDMGAYEFAWAYIGDFDGQCDVDFADFAILAAHWPETSCGVCGGADLTCDGDVDLYDLKEFANHWLLGK